MLNLLVFTTKKRIVSSLILLLLVFFAFIYLDLLRYGWMQAKGQLTLLWKAQPIEELLENKTLPDSIVLKLKLSKAIKEHATTLGLTVGDAYTTYYDQAGKTLLWNLSASPPFELKAYQLHFPLLGNFGYKGFFDLDKAQSERERLSEDGYDTNIRSVSAWSTLGWFNDPILSNLLDRPIGKFAETLFHELTHSTVFIKDSLTFNENLASFIGQEATISFLMLHYGDQSSELEAYQASLSDSNVFREHMLKGKDQLAQLYAAFGPTMSNEEKVEQKQLLISQILETLDTLQFEKIQYAPLLKRRTLPNNAYFMGFKRYHSYRALLEKELARHDGDLRSLIRQYKDL
ncbi:MAG: putative aminopeptidase [Paraglaciecola sp.]|jgi:predicted aminopeptidase